MKLLAIETAFEACSVALLTDGEVRERFELAPRRHAELLLPWVSELLAESDVKLNQLDALVFSRGPGSFTSLRIGIGVVQGLAWGSGLPVVPVSSMQAAAQAAAGLGVAQAIVSMDARMGEVFCGRYRLDEHGLMQVVGEEMVCAPGVVAAMEPDGWSGVGNGFERYPELTGFSKRLASVHPETWPRAGVVIELAQTWLKQNKPLPAQQAQPVYIRDQVAQKSI